MKRVRVIRPLADYQIGDIIPDMIGSRVRELRAAGIVEYAPEAVAEPVEAPASEPVTVPEPAKKPAQRAPRGKK
jgi:hypothetical protein